MRIPNIPGFDQQALEKYFKNTGWLLIGRVGALAIKMLVSIAVANYLQPANNGIFNGSLAYVFFYTTIASLGIDVYVVKELHRTPENKDTILGTAFGLKLIAGLLCMPLIALVFHLKPITGIPYYYILILSSACFLQSLNIIDSFFQAQVQSKYIMRVQIAGNIISAATKLVLIVFKLPVIWFICTGVLDIMILSTGYYLVYRAKDHHISNWRFNKQLAIKLLSSSWPLIISGVMVSIYMKIDLLMLQDMKGAAEAGAYSTVASLSEAWYFLPSVIVSSLFPAILNARRDDPARYHKRVRNLFDLMVYISVPIALIITFASSLIYKLYKPEYAYAAPVLSVHIWAGIFVFLGVASTQFLITENLNKLALVRTAVGAIINIGLNLLLIPKMGMMGAAIATLAAYAASTVFIIFIPKVSRQGLWMLQSLLLFSLAKKIFKR